MASIFVLRTQLEQTLAQINRQIEEVRHRAISFTPDLEDITQFQDKNGNFVMIPLLAAKAQVLSGLASLATVK